MGNTCWARAGVPLTDAVRRREWGYPRRLAAYGSGAGVIDDAGALGVLCCVLLGALTSRWLRGAR